MSTNKVNKYKLFSTNEFKKIMTLLKSTFTPEYIRKIDKCISAAFEHLQIENKRLAKSKSDTENKVFQLQIVEDSLRRTIDSQNRQIVNLTRKLRAAERSREAVPVVSNVAEDTVVVSHVVEDGYIDLPVAIVVPTS
jgi:hypothetical protein